MSKLKSILFGLGVGAGVMYFMDPRFGNRRRALVRDQAVGLLNDTSEMVDKSVEDMKNRARGLVAETYSRLSNEDVSDWLVEQRVRSEMGRHINYASAIKVTVDNGNTILMGPALREDVPDLIVNIEKVRGVNGVSNQLDLHDNPGDVPALQGAGQQEMDGSSWTPAGRLAASLTGIGMLAFGVVRGGFVGTTMSVAGIGLATRGIANKDLGELVGIEPGAINVKKGIHINKPQNEVYRFWSDFENFPKFMNHLISVKNLGSGRSHWVAKGPADTKVEWDAIETQNIPNNVISWESTQESEIKMRGSVHFMQSPTGNGTEVEVQMSYTPPAGVLGHAVAQLFGDDPKSAMNDDLMRMKSLIETGKTTSDSHEVTKKNIND